MRFRNPKLPREAAMDLRRLPLDQLRAYQPVLSPVYVYLEQNKKFIGIKGPMDFFDPPLLEKLKPLQSYYTTSFIDEVVPYESVATSVRSVIQKRTDELQMGSPPFEVSDAVMEAMASLWTNATTIEPFFVFVFVSKLLGPMEGDLLRDARDRSVTTYEKALLQSAWAVFLGLYLGRCDLSYLDGLRTRIFHAAVHETPDVSDLQEFVVQTVPDEELQSLSRELFKREGNTLEIKLFDRLEVMVEHRVVEGRTAHGSVFGKKGFRDV